jgi:hypothetical protein
MHVHIMESDHDIIVNTSEVEQSIYNHKCYQVQNVE